MRAKVNVYKFAEAKGFEPLRPYQDLAILQITTINHSVTPPINEL